MRNMDIGHDPVVAADTGHAGILRGTDMEGGKLADRIPIDNLQPGRLARIFFILRRGTDRRKLKEMIVAPDRGVALDHDMWAHGGAGANLDVGADHRVWTDNDRTIEFRLRIDQRAGMDTGHY